VHRDNYFNRNLPSITRYFALALSVGAIATFTWSAAACAQEATSPESSLPAWRRGVSSWTGNGYTLPTNIATRPDPVVDLNPANSRIGPATLGGSSATSPATDSEAPYTIPVDPTQQRSDTPISVDGPAPQPNPYSDLPAPIDESTSLELTSPSDQPEFRMDGPLGADAVLPLGPALPSAADPETTTSLPQVPSIEESEPSDRLEAEELALPVPEEIAVPQGEAAATPSDDDESVPADSIGEQIQQEAGIAAPPLEEEVIRWYQYPRRWMRGWDSHAELGLDGSTGNARTLAIQTGLETKRQTDDYTLALDFDYRQASNRSVTTEDNGRLNLDYDRLLHDSPWAWFAKYGMEWDKFKAFDLRLWVNGGAAYHWVRRDDATLVTRFGAGASKEIGAPVDDWIAEAVFAAEAERQLTSRQKVKSKVEYFPAWEDFGNFRLVSDVAWEILLDDSDNLSLKLAATDRYDSTPQGAKKNDLYYSLLLLYKF
jgi:hypothetical protein